MKIQKITDETFKKYGKVLAQYDCAELIREMEHTPLPEDVIYLRIQFPWKSHSILRL